MITCRIVEKILSIRVPFHPGTIERQYLVCNRNLPDVVFGLAGEHIKVLLIQVNILLF